MDKYKTIEQFYSHENGITIIEHKEDPLRSENVYNGHAHDCCGSPDGICQETGKKCEHGNKESLLKIIK